MGQVRGHIKDDAAALAQWVYRKCKNHDPMKIRDQVGVGLKTGRVTYKSAEHRSKHEEGTTQVEYATCDGRKFLLTVEEIT